jgi:hypothetical protein
VTATTFRYAAIWIGVAIFALLAIERRLCVVNPQISTEGQATSAAINWVTASRSSITYSLRLRAIAEMDWMSQVSIAVGLPTWNVDVIVDEGNGAETVHWLKVTRCGQVSSHGTIHRRKSDDLAK